MKMAKPSSIAHALWLLALILVLSACTELNNAEPVVPDEDISTAAFVAGFYNVHPDPNVTHSAVGEFSFRAQAAFLPESGLLTPDSREPSVNWGDGTKEYIDFEPSNDCLTVGGVRIACTEDFTPWLEVRRLWFQETHKYNKAGTYTVTLRYCSVACYSVSWTVQVVMAPVHLYTNYDSNKVSVSYSPTPSSLGSAFATGLGWVEKAALPASSRVTVYAEPKPGWRVKSWRHYVCAFRCYWSDEDAEYRPIAGCADRSSSCTITTVTRDAIAHYEGPGVSFLQLTMEYDDDTPPVITGSRNPLPNAHGWNNTNVEVSFSCEDEPGGSGIATNTVAGETLTEEGANQSVTNTGTCTDRAGNVATPVTVSGINIDKTAPTVTYTGNAGSYGVTETVSITCSASDALSGVDSHSCADIRGPAYSFKAGSNSYSASATDKAGNTGNGSTSFTVSVTYSNLCSLTRQFVSQSGVANSMCIKLSEAEAAAARGSPQAKAGALDAYRSEVAAQRGKALTAQQAEILIQLSNSF